MMGHSKEMFMIMEDFERDAQKDQLFLQEMQAQLEEIYEPPYEEDEATIIAIIPENHETEPVTINNTLPF